MIKETFQILKSQIKVFEKQKSAPLFLASYAIMVSAL